MRKKAAFLILLLAAGTGAQAWAAASCKGLSAQACYERPDCLPRFGGSVTLPNGATTPDMVFKGCADSPQSAADIEKLKARCAAVNGRFAKDPMAGYQCHCARDGLEEIC